MKAKQEDVVKEREKELARKIREQEKLLKKEIEAKQAKKKEQREKVSWEEEYEALSNRAALVEKT